MAIPTLGAENRTLLSPQLLLVTLVWLSWPSVTPAVDYGNEVTVWIEQGQAVAISVVNGSRDFSRPARDRNRLRHQRHQRRCRDFAPAAGFLAVPPWSKRDRDLNERVLERRVLPTFSVVRTNKNLYGFRGASGIWLDEPLGIQETVKMTHTTDYGAVFVTNERRMGFASLLGDFSSKALDIHERITRMDNENGLIIVTTSKRTFMLGSRLSGWEEFE